MYLRCTFEKRPGENRQGRIFLAKNKKSIKSQVVDMSHFKKFEDLKPFRKRADIRLLLTLGTEDNLK